VLDLGKVGIRVAVVNESVQVIGGVPDAFLSAFEFAELPFLLQDKSHGLVGVVQPIELGDRGVNLVIEVAELRGSLPLLVPGGHEFIPLIDVPQGLL
jgi:hypothetical protein